MSMFGAGFEQGMKKKSWPKDHMQGTDGERMEMNARKAYIAIGKETDSIFSIVHTPIHLSTIQA